MIRTVRKDGIDDVVELFLRNVSNRFVPRGLNASCAVRQLHYTAFISVDCLLMLFMESSGQPKGGGGGGTP